LGFDSLFILDYLSFAQHSLPKTKIKLKRNLDRTCDAKLDKNWNPI